MKMKKISNITAVSNFLRTKPGLKAEDIVKKLKVSKVYAYNLLTQARKKMIDDLPVVEDTVTNENARLSTERINELLQGRKKHRMQPAASWETVSVTTGGQPILAGGPTEEELNADNINPAHYKVGGIETIDFIEAKLTAEEYRGYLRGNVLKYMSRADHKGDRLENLKKAQWYLNREIGKA